MEDVPQGKDFSFTNEEKKILKFWDKIKALEQQLKRTKDFPEYVFYDGPPFATGKPHYGHILAGTIKDTVTRYYSMRGFHVERRFGWDCHSLPVEQIVDEELGIEKKEDVSATDKVTIHQYNEACRNVVTRYVREWKETVIRSGRWIDFEDDYKTMDLNFMESVRWVFTQLYEKGLVYKGFKVMPYSTGLKTPLSNFEAGENYKLIYAFSVSPGNESFRFALIGMISVKSLPLDCILSRLDLAPFTPFLTEVLYQNLCKVCEGADESIHFCSFPQEEGKREERIEQSVARMKKIIDLACRIHEDSGKPLKVPLREIIVVHPDSDFLKDIEGKLSKYLCELNVRSLVTSEDILKYSTPSAKPEVLGERLGKFMGIVAAGIKAMSQDDILKFERAGEVDIATHCLKREDIKVAWVYKLPEGLTEEEIHGAGDGDVLVFLDLRPDESLTETGVAREVILGEDTMTTNNKNIRVKLARRPRTTVASPPPD